MRNKPNLNHLTNDLYEYMDRNIITNSKLKINIKPYDGIEIKLTLVYNACYHDYDIDSQIEEILSNNGYHVDRKLKPKFFSTIRWIIKENVVI